MQQQANDKKKKKEHEICIQKFVAFYLFSTQIWSSY